MVYVKWNYSTVDEPVISECFIQFVEHLEYGLDSKWGQLAWNEDLATCQKYGFSDWTVAGRMIKEHKVAAQTLALHL